MAISNNEVARRFALFMTTGGETPSKNGRCLTLNNRTVHAYIPYTTPGGIFERHAACNSYRTRVAALVWNTWAKRYELWMDPKSYSPTAWHKAEIESAYRAQCRAMKVTPHVFSIDPDWADRSKPPMVTTELREVVNYAAQADMPRIQERMRYTALANAISRIDAALYLMMDGLPDTMDLAASDLFGPDYLPWRRTIEQYRTLRSTIEGFAALPIEQMRHCVRAWAELHKLEASHA
jgi:hypothetical protein